MLIEFKCANYKSIKDKITFSMLASKDNTFNDETYETKDIRLLRSAAIYGANGSGKSSFLNAIRSLRKLVIGSINFQPGDLIPRTPHKLELSDSPTIFEMQFLVEDLRYAYGVSFVEEFIVEEYLYYFPNGKQAKIFDRKFNDINIAEKFRKNLETSIGVLKPNRFFLSCAANFSSVKEIEDVFMFFKKTIVVYDDKNRWLESTFDILEKDQDVKNLFIDFMKCIDVDVKDVITKKDIKKFELSELPEKMPDMLKSLITSSDSQILEAKLIYDQFTIDLNDESSGIKKLFEILCPILEIIVNGRIFICDELETNLHPIIVLNIINLFKLTRRKKVAQLIFSTHDTSLLDLNIFRRDQIWFTELKKENRSTELYSLSELKNVRKDENIQKGYIKGKYGAIPILNDKITQCFNED